ncbi:hypothetical protein M422DRAFT_35063 [Sphaerobolus stellatus SS14]|uniref:Unplaced genomic scaffold SPHSTscaffold_123, whole genome shotgun sequence n=1 Tax=Sphaerobolus stellatus (strain SS14) TaxID=990650 RepID=A0A0C9TW22_SPHS4|nr:hypothetical protein M422DRAFT_35063 [Sphaerobolus stellatus SS14]
MTITTPPTQLETILPNAPSPEAVQSSALSGEATSGITSHLQTISDPSSTVSDAVVSAIADPSSIASVGPPLPNRRLTCVRSGRILSNWSYSVDSRARHCHYWLALVRNNRCDNYSRPRSWSSLSVLCAWTVKRIP